MSEWGQTKVKQKIISISTTFMKETKSHYEQKVVEKFIFLRLGEMHDCADPCLVFWS